MPAAGYGSFAADRIAPRGCRPRASALGYLSQLPELTRRFPPPWTVDETHARFIVRDANGQAVAYFYFENEPRRRAAAKLLTEDEARRIRRQREPVIR
jgi:hypothetical protein